MNRLLSLLAACMLCIGAYALSPQVATLSHNGEITTFYGASALGQAYEQAVDGDVITLSPGAFAGIHTTKSITVYGAGYNTDSIAGIYPTEVTNSGFSKMENDSVPPANFNGIYFSQLGIGEGGRAIFNNCSIRCSGRDVEDCEVSYYNCLVWAFLESGTHKFYNCIIDGIALNGEITSFFDHCMILNSDGYFFNIPNIRKSFLIVCGDRVGGAIDDSVLFINSWNNDSPQFNNVRGIEPKELPNIFEDFLPEYVEEVQYRGTDINMPDAVRTRFQYRLKDEVRDQFTIDGDEIGIHGGYYPWTVAPANPQISVFEVAPESTSDGKLNIKVEVKNN